MKDFATTLYDSKNRIEQAVYDYLGSKIFAATPGSYSIDWQKIEKPAIEILQSEIQAIFSDSVQFEPANNKNKYPDLKITYLGKNYAIDIKSVYFNGELSSRNDLGTMFSYVEKKEKYSQQFFLFIRYIKNPDGSDTYKIKDVFLNFFWQDVGQRSDRESAEYREKDGNLRPKPWRMFEANQSHYPTEKEFEIALNKAGVIRAKNIIRKQIRLLSNADLNALLQQINQLLDKRKQGEDRQLTVTQDPDLIQDEADA
jgi:hypothetical protein